MTEREQSQQLAEPQQQEPTTRPADAELSDEQLDQVAGGKEVKGQSSGSDWERSDRPNSQPPQAAAIRGATGPKRRPLTASALPARAGRGTPRG